MNNEMKYIILFTAILFCIIISCKREENRIKFISINKFPACGYDDPINEDKWLYNFIKKAQNDHTGNYFGNVWITKYNGQDVVVTDFGLGSGGVAYYTFNCNGDEIIITDTLLYQSLNNDNKIYSTLEK
jgi:hypothetical protein